MALCVDFNTQWALQPTIRDKLFFVANLSLSRAETSKVFESVSSK